MAAIRRALRRFGPIGKAERSREIVERTPQQVANAVRELGRGILPGTAFHLAGLLFVELLMPHADPLPRVAVVVVFLGFLLLRFYGFYLTSTDRGSLRQRVTILAAGAIGANLVWGLRTVAVQLHTGASEQKAM